MKITPGSTVIGKSGKKLLVDRVESDTIYSGDLKVLTSAVVKVVPPVTRFNLGDRVKYIGSDFNLKTQYAGVLEVWEISKKDIGSYTCLKHSIAIAAHFNAAGIIAHHLDGTRDSRE